MDAVARSHQAQRWPRNAEWARQDVIHAAEEAVKLLQRSRERIAHARAVLVTDPQTADRELADAAREEAEAETLLERIHRLMVQARNGKD